MSRTRVLMCGMAVLCLALACAGCGEEGNKPAPGADKALTLELADGVKMTFVRIPAGKFKMGSPLNEKDRSDDEWLSAYFHQGPQKTVTISKPFYMGVYEVTQLQYNAVMGANPSHFKEWSHPVESVSWDDAVAFCKKASEKTGRTVRLPTEAEWEYACRAGSTTRFSFGDDERTLGNYAWYSGNSDRKTHPAGQKRPNAWGLYDMHGNVWEWCQDWYAGYANPTETDPRGPTSGQFRVLRGGSWRTNAQYCRSADRYGGTPDFRISLGGFRVVVSAGVD